MRGLTLYPNQAALLVSLALVALVTWWLGMLHLQVNHDFSGLPAISYQAASALLLVQWLAIALLAGASTVRGDVRVCGGRTGTRLIYATALTLPFWPLLALCWMSSELAALPLLLAQFAAFFFTIFLTMLVARLAARMRGRHTRLLFGNTVCVLVAMLLWSQRTLLLSWFIV